MLIQQFIFQKYFLGGGKIPSRVGLGVARKGLFQDYDNNISDEKIKSIWIDAFNFLEDNGYKPVFFTNGLYEDYQFAKEIAYECKAELLDIPNNLGQLCEDISSMEFAIVTRLHASIIAYSYKVPTINLLWNNKQRMFGEISNRSEYYLLADEASDKIKSLIQKVSKEIITIDDEFANSTKRELNNFLEGVSIKLYNQHTTSFTPREITQSEAHT